MTEPEHLISVKMKSGKSIDFYRTKNKEVQVHCEDRSVKLPKGTGQQTLDLIALLESIEIVHPEK